MSVSRSVFALVSDEDRRYFGFGREENEVSLCASRSIRMNGSALLAVDEYASADIRKATPSKSSAECSGPPHLLRPQRKVDTNSWLEWPPRYSRCLD